VTLFALVVSPLVALVIGAKFEPTFTGVGFVAGFAYWWIFTANGATPGKKVTGLRVVDDAGKRPGYAVSLVRYAVSIVSGCLLWGYLRLIFDDRKQTWHDIAARTYVVRR
jgi:uncharacterized RDD family membrane protein YckC